MANSTARGHALVIQGIYAGIKMLER